MAASTTGKGWRSSPVEVFYFFNNAGFASPRNLASGEGSNLGRGGAAEPALRNSFF